MSVFKIEPDELPAIRISKAMSAKADKNLLFVVGGGLGDRQCAEPTIRFATENFLKWGYRVSVMCETPELFFHLHRLEGFYSPKDIEKLHGKFLPLYTYAPGNLPNQFFNANLMHPVDYASVCALRMQLPNSYKVIQGISNAGFPMSEDYKNLFRVSSESHHVVVHAGQTWPSRTIAGEWWDDFLEEISFYDWLHPVLVGNQTVELKNTKRCLDVRWRLSLAEFSLLCRNSIAVVTNDSSPIHLAAPGESKVAFLSTIRNPDHLYHWRKNGFGWNMQNFTKINSLGQQPWEVFDVCPSNLHQNRLDVFPGNIKDHLPYPREIVEWIVENKIKTEKLTTSPVFGPDETI